jgi:hypothetical protein
MAVSFLGDVESPGCPLFDLTELRGSTKDGFRWGS